MLLPCDEYFPIDKSEKISDTGQRRNTANTGRKDQAIKRRDGNLPKDGDTPIL
jgi:hypothetical protein